MQLVLNENVFVLQWLFILSDSQLNLKTVCFPDMSSSDITDDDDLPASLPIPLSISPQMTDALIWPCKPCFY
jgi:hypothetical protein